ncbi:DUF2064 domain-containing protein [Pontibacter sp. CAU 1760]
MQQKTSDTAILLFAHAAAHEAEVKNFSSELSARSTRKIASVLLNHTLAVSHKAKLPLVTVYTDRQQGESFGQRLANAFQYAFDKGYQRVICVGSDCPSLATDDLLQAAAELQHNNLVIGPASDGGAYLIGLHINSFDPERLSLLSWQSDQVLQELKLYAYRQQHGFHSFVLLQTKSDVDSREDLLLVLRQLPAFSRLKTKLLALLYKKKSRTLSSLYKHRKSAHLLVRQLLLRAPPAGVKSLHLYYLQTK